MERKILPKELISLIHHLKLNEAGWWDNGIKKLIEAVFWTENKHLSFIDIADSLNNNFSLKIESNRLRCLLDDLKKEEVLFEFENDLFKISEESLKKFKESLIESEKIEENAKKSFLKVLEECCPTLKVNGENTWVNFNNILLTPLVKTLGAKTYELISGKLKQNFSQPFFNDFVERYPTDLQIDLRKAISNFLSPNNDFSRNYVLGLLNTYFFIEAGNLSQEDIIQLNKLKNKLETFEVFVDSNFLFSILDLHDNPSNEAAQSLLKLIESLKDKILVKLYVSPLTVIEMQRVLTNQEVSLKSMRMVSNIILVASESNINGFKRKYFEIQMKSNYQITTKDYFDLYINNLVSVLREKKVELYNDKKFDEYKMKPDVTDDILSQIDFENSKHKKSENSYNPKDYSQLEHDMVLWHFVKDKRVSNIDNANLAKHWIVTIDYRFLGFDAFKRHSFNQKTPICIHPTTFIQLLQFWTPRSLEFEQAMLGNLRLPLLFGIFDSKAEKITINILSAISLYENAEDLSVETISSILYDDSIRSKIKDTKEIENNIEIISGAIIEKFNKSVEEKKVLERKLIEKDIQIKQGLTSSAELKNELSLTSKEKENKENDLKKIKTKLERLEVERKSEKEYEQKKEEHIRKLNEHIGSEWIEYSTQKNYFFIFVFIFIGLIITIILSFGYSDESTLKYIIPSTFFIFSLVFSFFNKDKIMNSFMLTFKSKKVYKEKRNDFEKEYLKENKPPQKVNFNN